MSGLLFNKIAAGVLVVALIGAGGNEAWRRLSGAGEHPSAAPAAAPLDPEQVSARAAAPEATPAPVPADAPPAETAPGIADRLPQEDAAPAAVTTPEAGAAAEPAAAVAEPAPLPPAAPDYAALFAAANLEEGKNLAVKCSVCHDFTDANKTLMGPPLYDLFGRKVASAPGFKYSEGPGSLSSVAGDWDAAKLDSFLENPKDLAPNTYMVLAGMKRESERINLMAYIHSLTGGEPKPVE